MSKCDSKHENNLFDARRRIIIAVAHIDKILECAPIADLKCVRDGLYMLYKNTSTENNDG